MTESRNPDSMADLSDVAARIARRELSQVELVERKLRDIERLNPILNAYITVLAEEAMAAARAAENEIAAGRHRGPLHGVPLSVKDLFWTAGIRTTSGSRVQADFVPTEDATLVARLKAAGAVIVAKANMLEFAYASVHPDFGPTKNPWDLTKTTSGSSGGSAGAVASGMDFGSFGSDTGGSIRIPASFCGIAGLKPSYGRVPRHGMQALSWILDHAGPFARSVRDVALLLGAVAGADPRDPYAADVPVPDYAAGLTGSLDGLTVGLTTNFLDSSVDPEIRAAVVQAADVLSSAGATVREIQVPELEGDAIAALMDILLPEASYYHRDWIDDRRADYTETVYERLQAGRRTTAVAYFAARDTRERIRAAVRDRMREIDLLVLPTTPMVATPLESTTLEVSQGEQDLGALIRLTGPFDVTGQPALSIPCGFSAAGLPIGLQIVGRELEDGTVLRAGHAYQERTDWHRRRPAVSAD